MNNHSDSLFNTLEVESLAADELSGIYRQRQKILPSAASELIEAILKCPSTTLRVLKSEQSDLRTGVLSRTLQIAEVQICEQCLELSFFGIVIARVKLKPSNGTLWSPVDIELIIEGLDSYFLSYQFYIKLPTAVPGSIGQDGIFRSNETVSFLPAEIRAYEPTIIPEAFLALLGRTNIQYPSAMQFQFLDDGSIGLRFTKPKHDFASTGQIAVRAAQAIAAATMILSSSGARADEAQDKLLEACMNPGTNVSLCHDAQALIKNIEVIANSNMREYGLEPAAAVVGSAARVLATRQIRVPARIGIGDASELVLETQRIKVEVKWNF
jgi:hypothetical protein